jgi:hypothetical protein
VVLYSGYTANVVSDNANNADKSVNESASDDLVLTGNYTMTNQNIDEERINGFLVKYQEYPGASCNETDSCVKYIADKMGMSEKLASELYYYRCINSICYAKPQRILNR